MATVKYNTRDWCQSIPCNDDYEVPLLCRPTFKDQATLSGGVVLPSAGSNPTGYKAVVGALYYNTNDGTLYYRNGSGWQALGVSGTPAPPAFPIQVTSALDSSILIQSIVNPDSSETWKLLADGTNQYFDGSGTLTGQLRYDQINDQLVYEDNVGLGDGTFLLGTLLATNGTFATQISTPKITSPTSNIDMSSKNLIDCGAVNAGSVGSNTFGVLTAGDMAFIAGVGANFDFLNGDSIKVKRIAFTGNSTNTNRLEIYDFPTGTLPVISVDRDGSILFTNGTDAIFGSQGYLEKVTSSGALGISFTKGAYDGTLFVGTITGPSTGLAIQAALGGTVTTFGPLTNDTSFSSPLIEGTTSVSTPKITSSGSSIDCDTKIFDNTKQIKQKFATSTSYPVPITIFNQVFSGGVTAGTPATLTNFTIPANLMANNGDVIRITVTGNGNGTSNPRIIDVALNGAPRTGFTLQTGTGSMWVVSAVCRRTGSNTYSCTGQGIHQTLVGSFGAGSFTTATAFTSSSSGGVYITSTTTGDVIVNGVLVEYIPAL